MLRYPCRCRKCGHRRTLAQLPHLMRNRCKCATCRKLREQDREAPLHCDCGGHWRVDWYRRSKEHKRAGCTCDGYHWSIMNGVHRRGSLECFYHERIEVNQMNIGSQVLITCDNWFFAPDGMSYRGVWGTVKAVRQDSEVLGLKTNARSTNWYIEIGNMIIAGCQIHYALECSEPYFGYTKDDDGKQIACRIYNADQ